MPRARPPNVPRAHRCVLQDAGGACCPERGRGSGGGAAEARHDRLLDYNRILRIRTLAPLVAMQLAREIRGKIAAYQEDKPRTRPANSVPNMLTLQGFRGMPPHDNPAGPAIRNHSAAAQRPLQDLHTGGARGVLQARHARGHRRRERHVRGQDRRLDSPRPRTRHVRPRSLGRARLVRLRCFRIRAGASARLHGGTATGFGSDGVRLTDRGGSAGRARAVSVRVWRRDSALCQAAARRSGRPGGAAGGRVGKASVYECLTDHLYNTTQSGYYAEI